jgi:hypothetical protein
LRLRWAGIQLASSGSIDLGTVKAILGHVSSVRNSKIGKLKVPTS